MTDTREQVERLAGEMSALATREAVHMPSGWSDAHGIYSDTADLLRALLSRLEAAEAENARLRDAIRPFVEYVHDDLRDGDHRYKFVRTVELGGGWIAAEDLRRALRALGGEGRDDG